MKLYEINQAFREVIENGFSVNEETGEVWDESSLDSLKADLADKREAVAVIIKELTAESDAVANEIKNLQARKKSADNHIEWLKGYLLNSLEQTGEKGFESAKCKVTTRKSESVTVDEDLLPIEWKKVSYSADKTRIKEAIKSGETIIGASIETKNNITIK